MGITASPFLMTTSSTFTKCKQKEKRPNQAMPNKTEQTNLNKYAYNLYSSIFL
jgi:hypothetical protein